MAWFKFSLVSFSLLGVFMASPSYAARELGSVRYISVDTTCNKRVSDCWLVEVSCPGLAPIQAQLKIRNSTLPATGTAIFTEGGSGNTFWGNQATAADNALTALSNSGFNTVEIAWKTAWYSDASASLDGSFDGYPTVACRPATVAQYIRDTFNGGNPDLAYCASGNSGGSSQVAYMLSHYGLDTQFDLIVPTSGPPISEVAIGCFQTPGYEAMWYTSDTALTIDQVFRISKGGPCVSKNLNYETLYRNASVSVGGNYYYPNTFVHFIFGVNDTTSAVAQGLYHFDTLYQAGTPLLSQEFIAGAGHQIHKSTAGAGAVRDKIIAECRKHVSQ